MKSYSCFATLLSSDAEQYASALDAQASTSKEGWFQALTSAAAFTQHVLVNVIQARLQKLQHFILTPSRLTPACTTAQRTITSLKQFPTLQHVLIIGMPST